MARWPIPFQMISNNAGYYPIPGEHDKHIRHRGGRRTWRARQAIQWLKLLKP